MSFTEDLISKGDYDMIYKFHGPALRASTPANNHIFMSPQFLVRYRKM
jgi:hypothetical protein